MPRRNRKARRAGQRPRRYHQPSRGSHHSVRERRRDRRELVELDTPPPAPALPHKCGNCREWLQPPASSMDARGRCLHPGSGIVAPDRDTPACDFYDPRR